MINNKEYQKYNSFNEIQFKKKVNNRNNKTLLINTSYHNFGKYNC